MNLTESWSRTLLRLWTLRRVAALPRRSPVAAIVVLAVLWSCLWVAIDRWQRQPDPFFVADGIPVLAWYALGVAALAALLRRGSRFGPPLLLAAGLVPVPLMIMGVAAAVLSPRWFWGVSVAAGLYGLVYLARGLRALGGRGSPWVGALLGVLFIVGFVFASNWTNAIPDVWNPREVPAAAADQDMAERESALFEQSDRIDAQLDTVNRDASPRPEAFFVGFAGVGDEKVFAQEIGLAGRVLGERYDIGDRRVALINDERDLGSGPLASVSGLDYALHGVAAKMRLDRDVLFLAISSHGSREPSIIVANSSFPLVDLTPSDLAEALQDAGIEWRVIIISACYAGGFIEPLRDARSIVITAAAPDRSSFGCSNDSDLTYFGEAFYRDALPAAASLRAAFDAAKTAIAARERAEGETPSNPQAFFGAEIEKHLQGLEGGADAATRALRRP